MRLPWTVVSLLYACISLCRSEETENDHKPGGVVYLIDTVNDQKNSKDKSGNIHEASYKLVDPIPFDQAGDGIYFKPKDGKALDKPEVSKMFCTQ